MMFDYFDTIPDLQFMAIFIGLLAATYVVEWIADVIGMGKRRHGQ